MEEALAELCPGGVSMRNWAGAALLLGDGRGTSACRSALAGVSYCAMSGGLGLLRVLARGPPIICRAPWAIPKPA